MDILSALNIQKINHGASDGTKKWLSSNNTRILSSENPATQEIIAKVRLCSLSDYEIIIKKAEQTFQSWREVPAPKRGELIHAIADELRHKKDFLGTLIAMESGKIKSEGDGEVQEMIDMADFVVGLSRMLYGKTMPSERSQHRLYEQWHPLGVVGVITAFNFPVAIWSWNAFIAAVCGNVVIWKPSRKVSLCAIAVQNICISVCEKLGYPGIFSLFIPDHEMIAERFVNDPRIPLMSFTGSIPIGRKVNEALAKRFGQSILELSGNNAVIIDETADLSLVIPAVVFGAVGTAGQRCTSIRRLIIHKSRYKEITSKLIQAYQKIKIGNPLNQDVLMGPLIDKLAVENYVKALKEVQKMDGKILYGGRALKQSGYFVEPTIVQAKNDWKIVQQETFAPILYVMTYQTLEEAIALQNNVPQGLSSAMFTQNLQHAEYFLSTRGSDCGIANINISTSGAEIGGAFGGEKETGGGREAGSDAWKAYMRRQTNTINWGKGLQLAQGIQFKIT